VNQGLNGSETKRFRLKRSRPGVRALKGMGGLSEEVHDASLIFLGCEAEG
jgi:hypothetical protein